MTTAILGVGAVTRQAVATSARWAALNSIAPPPQRPDTAVISDPGPDVEVAPVAAGDDTWTDPNGRVYRKRLDPQTGHLLLEHHSEQSGTDGAHLTLDITIDLAPEGTATRTVRQRLDVPSGDYRDEKVATSYGVDGSVTGEVTDAQVHVGAKDQTEHTVDTYTTGKVTHRVTDFLQVERATDATSGERSETEIKVTGTWDAGGQPIGDATVPMVERVETGRLLTPRQGINKDTDRTITSTVHSAGPLDAIRYDPEMSLVVRFNGHDGQYIERELAVPVTQDGQAHFDQARTVRDDDHQKGYVKALTQARIWGGLSSQLLAIAGVNLVRGPMGGLAKAMLWSGVAAGAAEVVGEGHALLDRRNDASVGRFVMGVYDTTWVALVAFYTRGGTRHLSRQVAGTPLTVGTAITGASLATAAAHVAMQARTPVGSAFDASKLLQLGGVASPTRPTVPGAGTQWRAVDRRFDPASQLGSQLTPQVSAAVAFGQ